MRYYGKPVYDPLPVSDPDKSDSEFSDLSEAAEKVVKAMNRIRVMKIPYRPSHASAMSKCRKRSLKSTATVMIGSLMGAQAI